MMVTIIFFLKITMHHLNHDKIVIYAKAFNLNKDKILLSIKGSGGSI